MTVFRRNLVCWLTAWLVCFSAAGFAAPAGVAAQGAAGGGRYSMADFAKVRKYDAHVHSNSKSAAFLEQARADGFELMSINVDYPAFPDVALQRAAALALLKADPRRFHWATTFSMRGFGTPGWTEAVNAGLARDAKLGARAVKIWKNVGMVEKDAEGKLIMLDAPGLSPVADRIGALGLTLIGHQGEPHNCWLPLEQMTTDTCICIRISPATKTRSPRATASSPRIRSCASSARTWAAWNTTSIAWPPSWTAIPTPAWIWPHA
jgi:hypothetical protein